MGRPADFDRLGDLLKEAWGPLAAADGTEAQVGRESGGAESRQVARLLALVWSEAVGEEVAANARPVQLRQGRLTVSASSSAWAQTLQLMADTVRSRLNERLGTEMVCEVVFRHAGWEENARQPRLGAGREEPGAHIVGTPTAVTPEEEEAIAGVKALGLEPDLEESILRAMSASFGRT
jgi:hypothetical protein